MPSQTGSKPRDDERLFFYTAAVMALVFGTGFCLLILLVNHHETLAGGAAAGVPSRPIAPDHPRRLIDFSLVDRTGRTVTRAEVNSRFLVVDFLYTSCSLTCPSVNRRMAQIQQLTAGQPDVRLMSLSVDPRDDTVEVLAKYGERFGADTNRWLLLTGDKRQLYRLIGESFLAQGPDDPFNYMPGNFLNTERIALVDPDGKVRAYFDGLREDAAQAVVAEINRLRK